MLEKVMLEKATSEAPLARVSHEITIQRSALPQQIDFASTFTVDLGAKRYVGVPIIHLTDKEVTVDLEMAEVVFTRTDSAASPAPARLPQPR
jgi:hypothetical protein